MGVAAIPLGLGFRVWGLGFGVSGFHGKGFMKVPEGFYKGSFKGCFLRAPVWV